MPFQSFVLALWLALMASLLCGSSAAKQREVAINSVCAKEEKGLVLPKDLEPCVVARRATLLPGNALNFTFEVPKDGIPYDITFTLHKESGGEPAMMLLMPNGLPYAKDSNAAGPSYLFISRNIFLPDGVWALQVAPQGGEKTTFTLRTWTKTNYSLLNDANVDAVKQLSAQCCSEPSASQSCAMLAAATEEKRKPEEDLCHIPPQMCDEEGNLIRFTLAGRTRSVLTCEQLPVKELAAFPSLRYLDLSNNQLKGTGRQVAAVVSSMENLTTLYLDSNLLTGKLDCGIVKEPLITLSMADNNFTGPIPKCFLSSKTLLTLDLSGSSMGGAIPTPAKDLPLQFLFLAQALLTGPLPPEIADLKELKTLQLSNNQLTGELPALPVSLEILHLMGNSFSGTLPDTLADLAQLQQLNLMHNNLKGELPKAVLASRGLTALQLDNNSFSGAVDALPWKDVQELRLVTLSFNQLTGSVPAELAALPQLQALILNSNNLSGSLEEFGASMPDARKQSRLMQLNLSSNSLTGGVPDSLIGLGALTFVVAVIDGYGNRIVVNASLVDLSSNPLDGPFPMWVFTALERFVNVLPPRVFLPPTLTCPDPGTVDRTLQWAQDRFNFTCTRDGLDGPISVESALTLPLSSSKSPRGTTSPSRSEALSTSPDHSTDDASDSSSSKKKSGLGIGAIIGICVAAVVAIAVVMVLVYIFAYRALKNKKYNTFKGNNNMQMLPQSSKVLVHDTV